MYNCMFVSALPDHTCNSEKSSNGGNKQLLLLLLLLLLLSKGLLTKSMLPEILPLVQILFSE